MKTTTLTQTPQRGTLTYMKPDYSFDTIEGWFHVEPHTITEGEFIVQTHTVIMRKIHGRNTFQFCSLGVVYDFTTTEVAK